MLDYFCMLFPDEESRAPGGPGQACWEQALAEARAEETVRHSSENLVALAAQETALIDIRKSLAQWEVARQRMARERAKADASGTAGRVRLAARAANDVVIVQRRIAATSPESLAAGLAGLAEDADAAGVWADVDAVHDFARDVDHRLAVSVSVLHTIEVRAAEASASLARLSDAIARIVRRQYRRVALRYHPDRFAGAEVDEAQAAEAAFADLGEAYVTLANAALRREYMAMCNHELFKLAHANDVDADTAADLGRAQVLAIESGAPDQMRKVEVCVARGERKLQVRWSTAPRAAMIEIALIPPTDALRTLHLSPSPLGGSTVVAVHSPSVGLHQVVARGVNSSGDGPWSFPAEFTIDEETGELTAMSAADLAAAQQAAAAQAIAEIKTRNRARRKARAKARAQAAAASTAEPDPPHLVAIHKATRTLFKAARKHSPAMMVRALAGLPCQRATAAAVNGANRAGDALLVVATREGDEDAAKWLVDHFGSCGLDCNAVDNATGRTPLAWSIVSGAEDVTDALLRLGRRTIDLDLPDFAGWTPLHFAVRAGKPRLVERLIRMRAPLNAASYECPSVTPLHVAVEHSDAGMVAHALAETDVSPLGLALMKGNDELVLLAELVRLTLLSDRVELLLQLVGSETLNASRDDAGNSVLHAAVALGTEHAQAVLGEAVGAGAECENAAGLLPKDITAVTLEDVLGVREEEAGDNSGDEAAESESDSEEGSEHVAGPSGSKDVVERMEDESGAGSLDLLPVEIIFEVLRLLEMRDVVALSQTCRAMRALLVDNILWRKLFRRAFPG
ncbi:26S proteasome non-ATPase regulatory subunit 10 [Thecamonas trahens ATCC 50062]|uniref:26S proteasome non-ATPase regulatory subunit 10 n=1 Tax=Thecamonas trahens ATCC 50062 TaxID=461836 RepID=A0A0L0DAP6_THETB|nr:26S proteasome non-ATPase regulatory subunit 10 [Thecamonas trahens ATCC 50062]KNC49417.1 26S proteasome non-ATPase regulatory subunit 10 [Thecamonas trahens ATCC 50062]|eukprot:XP_013757841.1 26S proteasome non-ATPase regulatory subunit 10 [Thecamonas trahens ATCC 50062]